MLWREKKKLRLIILRICGFRARTKGRLVSLFLYTNNHDHNVMVSHHQTSSFTCGDTLVLIMSLVLLKLGCDSFPLIVPHPVGGHVGTGGI